MAEPHVLLHSNRRRIGMNFFVSDESLVLAATILMALAMIAALVTSKRRTGLLLTPVTVFFLFASIHVVFGRYAAAVLTDEYSFVSRAALGPFLDQSFLVISTGLTCCLLGFTLFPCVSSGRVTARLARISCKGALDQICARSRVMILIAMPLIIIGLQHLGGIPLFSDNPRHDRYLLNFTPEHRLDTFMVNRGREIVVFPAAALALGWYFRKRRLMDGFFVAIAAAGCLLTATRAPLLICVAIVMTVLVWKGRFRAVALAFAVVLAGLIASELALGGDSNTNTGEWTTLQGIGSDLAEVRDLGWVLLKQNEPYYGLTFIAGLVPIPSFASDFTQTYHLRTVTLNAIGFPLTAAHGGLRITYSGEWYLNFGWPGVVIGGLLYGWMCSRFSRLFHRLRAASQLYPVGAYMVACAWATVSFMVYMSGSASGGTLKTYAFVLFVFLFRLRQANRTAVKEHAGLIPQEMATTGGSMR
jgi:oligosaccharide repeat unit polymerase